MSWSLAWLSWRACCALEEGGDFEAAEKTPTFRRQKMREAMSVAATEAVLAVWACQPVYAGRRNSRRELSPAGAVAVMMTTTRGDGPSVGGGQGSTTDGCGRLRGGGSAGMAVMVFSVSATVGVSRW